MCVLANILIFRIRFLRDGSGIRALAGGQKFTSAMPRAGKVPDGGRRIYWSLL